MNFIFSAVYMNLVGFVLFLFFDDSKAAAINKHTAPEDTSQICLTPPCVIRSANILQSLDPTVDPCDDFYAYSCWGWEGQQTIPRGAESWNNFDNLSEENIAIIIKGLEEEGSDIAGIHSEAVEKAKRLYALCMNEQARNNAGAKPVFQIIAELGGWELIASLKETSQHNDIDNSYDSDDVISITRLLASIHGLGSYPLFGMTVSPDDSNSSRNIISFFQSGLGMGVEDYYINDDQSEEDAYIEFGLQIVSLLLEEKADDTTPSSISDFLINILPPDDPSALFHALAGLIDITEFEGQLALAYVPENETRNPEATYHKMSVAEFVSLIPQFDIAEYLAVIFGEEIPLHEDIVVYMPSYFTKLNTILEGVTDRLVRAYSIWNLVQDLVYYLPARYRMVLMDFLKSLHGYTTLTPDFESEQCAALTTDVMGMVAGALYVDRYSSPQSKAQITSMIENMRRQFIESIPSLDWMDENTKQAAKRKAVAMVHKTAYPPWILDAEKLDRRYTNITVTSDVLLDNVLDVRRFEVQQMLHGRRHRVKTDRWFMNPAEANAYYEQLFNEIVFPAGILQPPFYDTVLPKSMQYGAIGSVIGHELIHAFDASGRHYDADGNLNDWWDERAEAAYRSRAQCLVHQYSNFTLGKHHLDGEKTLNENIADNGGLRLALAAYQYWLRTHPHEEFALPGLHNLTTIQTFFLSAAQVWCDVITPVAATLHILLDGHALEPFRVLGPMSNMVEFAEAFSCPVGSPMNPEEKCRVW